MPRVKRGVTTRTRHKEVISAAKGFRGRRDNVYRIAKQAIIRTGQYAYRDRHNEEHMFHALWITRINAGTREHGLTYDKFMNGLKKASIKLNRKVLSDMAIHGKVALAAIVNQMRASVA